MDNAARVDELWSQSIIDAEAAPHLEANRWLTPVVSTRGAAKHIQAEPRKIEFLGHTIDWTQDRDRPFPRWVGDTLIQMLAFAELPANWDSYGGRPLQLEAVGPALHLIMQIHQRGHQARLIPLPNGGLGFRLSKEGFELEIDIADDGSIEGLLEPGEDAEIGPGAGIADAKQLLDRYFAS